MENSSSYAYRAIDECNASNVQRRLGCSDPGSVVDGNRFKNDNAINDELSYFTNITLYYLEKEDDNLMQTFHAQPVFPKCLRSCRTIKLKKFGSVKLPFRK